jgi:hypothetical protein
VPKRGEICVQCKVANGFLRDISRLMAHMYEGNLNWRGQSEWKQEAIPQKSDDFELLKIEILTRTPEYSKWKLLKVNLYYLQTALYFRQPFNLHYVSYMLWCSHFRKETEQNYPVVILPN